MNERTRQRVCRCLWLLICVAPTLLTSLWCGYRHSPHYRLATIASWQSALAERLGLDVLVGEIEQRCPGQVRFTNVRLVDPETSIPWVRCERLDASHSSRGWVMLAMRGELLTDHAADLAQVLHERLIRFSRPHAPVQELLIDELRLVDEHSARTLVGFRAHVQESEEGPRVDIEFRLHGFDSREPVRIAIARRRQQYPPLTHCTVDARDVPLPCPDLQRFLPSLAILGQESTFQGLLTMCQRRSGWEGTLKGRIRNIDLESVVLQPFGQRLTGEAELILNHVEWKDGRIIEASGEVSCLDGEIGRSLFAALSSTSGLRFARTTRFEKSTESRLPYQQLAFGFRLNAAGLVIRGKCDGEKPGVVMSDEKGTMLAESNSAPIPVINLVKSLYTDRDALVPANPEAERLASLLPFPRAAATTASAPKSNR